MKKIYFAFLFMILLSGLVAAADWPICIDLKKPTAPGNLAVPSNLQLTWTASTDEPACSGIAYYKIYLNKNLIGTSTTASYSSTSLPDGTYTFEINAVDKAGNQGPNVSLQVTFPLSQPPVNPPAGGGGGGGGGSGSSTWCGDSICNGAETCTTCSRDCGACSGITGGATGNETGQIAGQTNGGQEGTQVNITGTQTQGTSGITGAVIGVVKKPVVWVPLIIIALVAILVFFFILKKRK